MESARTSHFKPCGICGKESGAGLATLFGHQVHKKCKDKFVLNRELAWVIDAVVGYIALRMVLRPYFGAEVETELEAEGDLPLWIECGVFLVFMLKDSIRGISLGKLITGLQVVDTRTLAPIGPLQSIQRNLITLIPLAPIVLAFQMRKGPRFGEGWAHTRVIERGRRNAPAFAGEAAVDGDWSSGAKSTPA